MKSMRTNFGSSYICSHWLSSLQILRSSALLPGNSNSLFPCSVHHAKLKYEVVLQNNTLVLPSTYRPTYIMLGTKLWNAYEMKNPLDFHEYQVGLQIFTERTEKLYFWFTDAK